MSVCAASRIESETIERGGHIIEQGLGFFFSFWCSPDGLASIRGGYIRPRGDTPSRHGWDRRCSVTATL